MPIYRTPGVYKREEFPAPPAGLLTGVPAFLGFTEKGFPDEARDLALGRARPLTLWPHFEARFGRAEVAGYLAHAVRGLFANGGNRCYVAPLDPAGLAVEALRKGLEALASVNDVDLVCAPDIVRPRQPGNLPPDPVEVREMQAAVLEHCDAVGDRFAILDSLPRANSDEVLRQRRGLRGTNGALYYPWLRAADGLPAAGANGFVPPCGHLAGVYARSDRRAGVHKAPANEALEGALDLEINLTGEQQGELNPAGVNCLRAFPGRGIRVWGARTLSANPAWTYINARRLFLTAGRWIGRNMPGIVFEPNDPKLWARIRRELTGYFNGLFERGALAGRTPQEAFYVKCDEETNPPEVRDADSVVTVIGLAPTLPSEFVVVRIVHGPGGVAIAEPVRAAGSQ